MVISQLVEGYVKLLICDKDGTLVRPISGETFVQHPEDQELLPGVAQTIARHAAEGWTIAIASNQGGVQHKFKTLDEAGQEMIYLVSRLLPDIDILNVWGVFCPDDGNTLCDFDWVRWRTVNRAPTQPLWYRKPNPGMLTYLIDSYNDTHVSRILFVGDRTEDQQAAQAAGVDFMWASDWIEK